MMLLSYITVFEHENTSITVKYLQEASFVGVNDNTDDLRCGNVKSNYLLPRLRYTQEEAKCSPQVVQEYIAKGNIP